MPFCCFDIDNDGIRLLKRHRQFNGGQISASKSEKPTSIYNLDKVRYRHCDAGPNDVAMISISCRSAL